MRVECTRFHPECVHSAPAGIQDKATVHSEHSKDAPNAHSTRIRRVYIQKRPPSKLPRACISRRPFTQPNGIMCASIQQPRGGCRLGLYLRGGPASAHEDHRREELQLLAWQEERGSSLMIDARKADGVCAGRGHLARWSGARIRRCMEHACAGTLWWWCCVRACTMHHRGLGTGQRRRARVLGAAIRKRGSGTRSYSNWECAGLSPPQHACVLYYIRAMSVRYPHIRTISVRYPRARTLRYIRARQCAYPTHIQFPGLPLGSSCACVPTKGPT